MQDAYTYAKGSASTALHASVDALAFYGDILPRIPSAPGSIIIDYGGGIGRDALALHERAGGDALVFSIDPDPKMWADSRKEYPDRLHLLEGGTPARDRPNFVADTLPAVARLDALVPGLEADFALCNAVLMFIPPEDREASLRTMTKHLKPGSPLAVRFRTVDLKPGMYPISEEEIDALSARIAFNGAVGVERTAPAADPKNRTAPDGAPYLWHQRIFTRQP